MKKTVLLPMILILTLSLQLTGCKKEKEVEETKVTITVKLDGDTVSGADVDLYYYNEDIQDDERVGTKTTDSSGKVVFKDLEAGSYIIESFYTDNLHDYEGFGTFTIAEGEAKSVTLDLMEF